MQKETKTMSKHDEYTRASQPDLHEYLMPWVIDNLESFYHSPISTDCEQPHEKAKNQDAWLEIERKEKKNVSNKIVLERKYDGYCPEKVPEAKLDVAFEVFTNCPLSIFNTRTPRFWKNTKEHTDLVNQIRYFYSNGMNSNYYGMLLINLPENHYTVMIKCYNQKACRATAYLIRTNELQTMYRTSMYEHPYAATTKRNETWQNICACIDIKSMNSHWHQQVIVSSMDIPPQDFKQYYIGV